MTYIPGNQPVGRGGMGSFWVWVTVFLMAASVYILVKVQTVWSVIIAASLFLIAFMIQKILRSRTSQMTVQVSVLGVVWFHPAKGGGSMRWGNIGAVSVRDKPERGELALMLTPRNIEEGGAMVVDMADLAPRQSDGRERFLELAAEVMAKMPADTVMDRSTKAWVERMGLTRGKG